MDLKIYEDIAVRTGGDIYIGVVGPVRTGKSTFIKRFMDTLVIPSIQDENAKARAVDELPQSADGKTIMTTEPKFVPNEAVEVALEKSTARLRLIDCVGYLVEGAIGHSEDGKPRLVHTPWSESEIPFTKAAELGTEKVIKEHSTIGILVTTDGTITELERSNYIPAEERVIAELKSINKPFIIVVNSKEPTSPLAVNLAKSLEERHGVASICLNVASATPQDFAALIEKVLLEFPIKKLEVELPGFLRALPKEHKIIKSIISAFAAEKCNVRYMKDFERLSGLFDDSDWLLASPDTEVNSSTGVIKLSYHAREGVMYKVLSEECGKDIADDYALMKFVAAAGRSENDYGRIRDAMLSAESTGYGVVNPDLTKTEIAVPELIKKGSQYGIKFNATAASYHIIKVDIGAEVSPTIGSEQQSEEFLKSMLAAYDASPESLWNTNIFGRQLSSIVMEDIAAKTASVPTDTQKKLRKTITRIVNENRGGILCILI